MRTLVQGLGFGESVRRYGDQLWLCDWRAGVVLRVAPSGDVERVLDVEALALCIDWLPDGRLLVVHGREGRVLRREPGGALAAHAAGASRPLMLERVPRWRTGACGPSSARTTPTASA